jgi:beta-galactosidase
MRFGVSPFLYDSGTMGACVLTLKRGFPLRTIIPFNHHWLYLPERVGEDVPDSRFEKITLPHTNALFPHHNFDDLEYQFISTYRKRFILPEPLIERRLYLDFEGAMIAATMTINGHHFEEHRGGFTPFSFDITDYVNEHGENLLEISLDSTERKDIPPFGHTVDYLTFGGIYREVSLRYVEPVHWTSVYVRTFDVLTPKPKIELYAVIHNQTEQVLKTIFNWQVVDQTVEVLFSGAMSVIAAPGETLAKQEFVLEGGRLWSLTEPVIYTVEARLKDEHRELDRISTRFGLREAQFRQDGFYLNGEQIQLFGLNRHQTYPYIGAAAPARLQRKDADILKYELGCNIVRTAHYPQSKHFLNRCDEVGLLVFEEIPGWQHIGDEAWQKLALRDVRRMIERDRNHPSIVLWGVRINESWDNTEFYTATNQLARQLDPTRQTGGVRYFISSEFLEDVFTFNDFSDAVTEPDNTPHLITEFNGHMFPAKSYDHDARLVEQAVRHARIQSLAATTGAVTGAIGWCAFDYNTHMEFGAGDRICYHGVMDIFRLPKYDAYFYESQISPQERIVLRVATNWSLGDYSAGTIEPVYVFSNCDRIEVFVGDEMIGLFSPDVNNFPNLKYPPFVLTGLGMMLAQP